MCGRFTLASSKDDIAEALGIVIDCDLLPRYNVAPTQDVLAVLNDGTMTAHWLRWGLVPSWADDPSIGNRMINARAETLQEKPSFRTALKKRRCIIVADSFYEWRKNADGTKTPMRIRLKNEKPFAFAGLWEIWSKGPSPLTSCTIITTSPNELTRTIHDRMPAILPPADFPQWLAPGETDTADLLRPYPAKEMEAYPVGKLVNSPGNDTPQCIQPA